MREKTVLQTCKLKIFGIVQGVGFRPFVSRTANALGITGDVCNKGSYVEVRAQGTKGALQNFRRKLETDPPERAVILKILQNSMEEAPWFRDFQIVESAHESGDVFVSPDIAICPKCQTELFDKTDRRYLHPFINCTSCGPRLTILDSMPYDRERTSMGAFPMCPACRYEYTHAETRRYDAQPVCCNDCGPHVYLLGGEERDHAAITRARHVLQAGGIVAVKGVGGFHLACDARNEAAVQRLRERKNRPQKPFAVMLRGLDAVRRECRLSDAQKAHLDNHQKPIVLLEKSGSGKIAAGIAPAMPSLGVMLPYTPLHLLLFSLPDELADFTDCLVMTSGNPSGAPICRTDEDVRETLSSVADLILSHDREIRLRADDSVMDFYDGAPYMIRRSRGYAPLPLMLSADFQGSVLGIGGELKNTFCLAKNSLFYPSPYLGDMSDLRTLQALRQALPRMERLLAINPAAVAADLHPRYETSRFAETLGLPVFKVQHHHAHVLSVMAENDHLAPVIGVSFDGTGYGTDETIWGGEILLSTTRDFQRIASLAPFFHAGGDLAAREGWRLAVSLLHLCCGRDDALVLSQELELATEKKASSVIFQQEHGLNTTISTSAGRLFDAVSALLGIRRISTYEGEAAVYLQFAAEAAEKAGKSAQADALLARWKADGTLQAPPTESAITITDGRFLLASNSLFRHLLQHRLQKEPSDLLALAFHRGLAAAIRDACKNAREMTGCSTAALTGGVFQNTLLLRLTQRELEDEGFRVLHHSMIPTNDGGIAVGQALFAMQQMQDKCNDHR
nr:carbamoyltransferase HypF [uncultured Selenomonas sp.]